MDSITDYYTLIKNQEFDLDFQESQSQIYLDESNSCKDIIQKFIDSKYNKYFINEINDILNFLFEHKKTCKNYIEVFRTILKSKSICNDIILKKIINCLKIQSLNIKEIKNLITHFNEIYKEEEIINNMISQKREVYIIYKSDDPSTTNNLVFDDFEIIYLIEPYMEQTYEDDMLLNYIDENIKIIKKANLKYQALYN